MQKKLEMEIRLNEIELESTNNIFYVHIKFQYVDPRFNGLKNQRSKHLSFRGRNGFMIHSLFDRKYGCALKNALVLPTIDNGPPMKIAFSSDAERKIYIKDMLYALDNWANFYSSFDTDSNTYMYMRNNRFIYGCKNITKKN